MESKKKISTGAIVGIIVLAVLSVVALVCSIIGSKHYFGYLKLTPGFVAWVIMLVAIIYYAIAGYKRPHGNLLRVIFFLISITCLNGVIDSAKCVPLFEGNALNLELFIIGLDGISALMIAYIGGRLDKIKKNIIPLILITAAKLAKSVLFISLFIPLYSAWGWGTNLADYVWCFSTFVLWLDVAFAYILRYKEHKEAGLTDK